MGKLDGKVSLITGGANRLGLQVAELFAEEGAKVVIADIDVEKGEKAVADIKAQGGEAIFISIDVKDPDSLDKMIHVIMDNYDRLDIAVNSAAREKDHRPIAEMDMEEFDDIIDTNLKGLMLSVKYEVQAMLETGGSIINVSSVGGLRAQKNVPAHITAKHGVIGLTRNVALGYSSNGIRVNAVAPGSIDYPGYAEAMSQYHMPSMDFFSGLSMMKRPAKGNEVALAILWLASDHASFVTGAVLPIDGGFTSK